MKTILTLAVCLFSFSTYGQDKITVNGVDISSLDLQYVEIVGMSQFLNPNKVTVYLYYGQEAKLGSDQRIEGSDGKAQKFFGMVDALNFMYKNGWEYRDAYIVTTQNQNVYHYILQRKKNSI